MKRLKSLGEREVDYLHLVKNVPNFLKDINKIGYGVTVPLGVATVNSQRKKNGGLIKFAKPLQRKFHSF